MRYYVNSAIMKKVKLLFAILLLLFSWMSMHGQELVSGNFDKNTFTFNFSFENTIDQTLYITSLGALTQVNFGEFYCPAKDGLKNPLSDFVLFFEPTTDTVFLNQYVGIKIEPGEIGSFSYSVLPDISKVCDNNWAFEVTAMVRFHNGYTFWSASELLISENYFSEQNNKLSDQEIQTVIYQPDVAKKIAALNSLQYSSLGQAVKERLCESTLKHKELSVRNASALAIKDNNLTFLSDQLIANFFSAQSAEEKIFLIRILGSMKDPKFVDPLIGIMINGELEQAQLATKSLIKINRTDIKSKVSYMFNKNISWAKGDEVQQEKFLLMSQVLIHFKDESSVETIKKVLNDDAVSTELKYEMLAILAGQVNGFKEMSKFISSLAETVEPFFGHKDNYVRYNALNVFLAGSNSEKDQKKVIKKALKDKDFNINCRAAVWAGELGFNEFKEDVKVLCNGATGPEYYEICQALIKLNSAEE